MNIIDRLLSVVAPTICVGCRCEGAVLCTECCDRLDDVPSQCYGCLRATRFYKPCTACVNIGSPEHVWTTTWYRGPGKATIAAYKFDVQRSAARDIGACIEARLPYFTSDPVVAYVPTSAHDVRTRGFDHAKLLAREVANRRGLRLAPVLIRVGSVQQHGSARADRLVQLKDAFRATNEYLSTDKDVVLVDDVLTTGATIEACTRVLKNAGARSVSALIFARTPKD